MEKKTQYIKIKRILDFILAIILIFLLSIPMLIIAILVKIEDNGPIIYKAKRVGKDLKEFRMYKFRTMKIDRKELESLLTHDEMVTKIGKILRRTSLDELPQLFNILKGEMSFIGPRPWIPEYYEYFTEEQKKRANVLPGISGLAQVNGRNKLDILQKIQYDLEYIKNINLRTDISLVLKSVIVIFGKSNSEITEQGIKEEIEKLKEVNK